MWDRKKNALGNLVAFAISLLLTLVILEIALGFVRPKNVAGNLPPGRYTFNNHEFVQKITINRLGFREAGFAPASHTRNVLLLGDSFVIGTGQSDHETIAWLLNSHFTGKEYQFFNGGVSGTDIGDYADVYRNINSKLPIKFSRVIIFVFLGNDFLNYERLPEVKLKRNKKSQPKESREVTRVFAGIMPNTIESIRYARRLLTNVTVPAVPQVYSAETHIEWFNENCGYFERPPMSDDEKKRLEERFNRIPAKAREMIRHGLINKWCYHVYVTGPMNDFIYNMDSAYNEKIFASTMRQLDRLINMINTDVSIVLIPDKFQVSEEEQFTARTIMSANDQDVEFHNLLEVNARTIRWISQRHPRVRVYDATSDLLSRGATKYYYRIDGHMKPPGAELIAKGVLNILQ